MRLPPLDLENLTVDQQRSYERILSGPRNSIEGPLSAWLHLPALADVLQEYGAYCRFRTGIRRRYAEMAILLVAAQWKAGVEWQLHVPPAIEEGFTEAEIEAMRRNEDPGFTASDDRVVRDFCLAMVRERQVDNALYACLVKELGEESVIELVGILGYYVAVAMTVTAFKLPGLGGTGDPFADLR